MSESNAGGPDRLGIVDAGDAPDGMLDEFYDVVLAPSFPDSELMARDELVASLGDPAGATCAAFAVAQDGGVVGGAVGQWFPGCRVMLTAYLATHPGRRGGGIGRRVLRAVIEDWRHRFGPLLVLGEVEDPRHYRDRGFGDPVRRLAFYASEGAQVIDVPYFQPSLRPGEDRVPHLLLMTFAVDERCRRGDELDSTPVRCFLERNLATNEGGIADDTDTSALWAALTGPTVRLLDPRDLDS